ncbi:universal stress protein [Robiginitalea sediminis]|uniref:universal stress protein n=1 Tax=Robiginitalea sediminis TaxID=1982593 RepID=UPI000B4BDE51|nr:universal stress protein [Robiginitalea sediminis]
MDRITKILVPYDFSEVSDRALRYAIDFAGSRPEKHIEVCFMQEKEDQPALEAAFNKIKSGLSKAFRAKLSWVAFSPPSVEGLLKKCQWAQPDLIVMGTAGSEDPNGTTKTSETVLSTECPVLVVPHDVQEEFQLKTIALVLGSKEIDDPHVLGTLLDVARTFNAKVHVLTIENKPGTYGYSESEERNEQLLEYYLESFYSHHIFIENEDVVQGIFDYVREKEIDMLAILPRNHARKGTPSEGRLTRILTLQSHSPLLAIEH